MWIIIFVFIPIIIIMGISLSNESNTRIPFDFFVSIKNNEIFFDPKFSNFKNILTEPIYYQSFFTSIRFALISTFCCFVIGYPIAYFIFLLPRQYKVIALLFVTIPFWTSLLIRIYALIIILKNNGLINNFLIYLGVIDRPIDLINSEMAVILGITYTYLPFMIMPIYSSLEKMQPSLLEAAADLGSRPSKTFWSIVFPMSSSGIFVGSCLVFMPALGEYVIPELLGGINNITIGKMIWSEFFFNRDWVVASSISILLIIIIAAPFVFISKLMSRVSK